WDGGRSGGRQPPVAGWCGLRAAPVRTACAFAVYFTPPRGSTDLSRSVAVTRIKTVPWSESDDRLRQSRQAQHALDPPEYAEPVLPIDDDIAGIVASHSLIPDALHHAFATFGALMSPDLPLTRRQHEMIATVVSVTNRCYYCSTSHLEFLRRVT